MSAGAAPTRPRALRPRAARPRRLPVGRRRVVEGAPEAVAALREAGKGIAFLTNDGRHAPDHFVRKLWRLGFQASLDEVVTCGAALQFALAERRAGRLGVRDRLAGARRPRRRRRAADRQQHGVRHARRPRRRRRARGLRLPRAADRHAGRAARRGADRADARPHVPDARRPVARVRAGARRGRGGDGPPRRADGRQARARRCTTPRATGSGRAATWRWATGSTSTSPARGAPGSTARSC